MSNRWKRLSQQKGYSLLALVFVIAIISMILVSSVDDYHAEIMRDKEIEFIFRGQEISKAIARYNNFGRLAPLHLSSILPTKLKDLTKKTNVNGQDVLYLRNFALNDVLTNDDWDVIRAGDPRIVDYLKDWSEYYQQPIPSEYLQFIGIIPGTGFNTGSTTVSGLPTAGQSNNQNNQEPEEPLTDPEGISEPTSTGQPQVASPVKTDSTNNKSELKRPDRTVFDSIPEESRPIIGVVSRNRHAAYRRLFNKDVTYDKWLFIYMPPANAVLPGSTGLPTGTSTPPPTPTPTPRLPSKTRPTKTS